MSSQSVANDSSDRDNDYYMIGLPPWKKDLLRRRTAGMVKPASAPRETAGVNVRSDHAEPHNEEVKRSNSVLSALQEQLPGVNENAPMRGTKNEDDIQYEPGFVSKLRSKWSKLLYVSEDVHVNQARRSASVETLQEAHAPIPPRSQTDTRAGPVHNAQRRRSSGCRDVDEIVILEKGKHSAVPNGIKGSTSDPGNSSVDGVSQPRTSDISTRTNSVKIDAEARLTPHALPGGAWTAKIQVSVKGITSQSGNQPAAVVSANHTVVAGRPSAGLQHTLQNGVGLTSGFTPKDSRSDLARAASRLSSLNDKDAPVGPELALSGLNATDSSGCARVEELRNTCNGNAVSRRTDSAPPLLSGAEPTGYFIENGAESEPRKPALREVRPERGTGKRLLDTRTETGFQRKVPDYEIREFKTPIFINDNVVIGKGSLHKVAATKARRSASFNEQELTHMYEYPSETELMMEMVKEAGSAYCDDPSTVWPSGGDDEDDRETREAALTNPLSSRVAAAAGSGNLGSYRASSMVGTYSFGQHMLREAQEAQSRATLADDLGLMIKPAEDGRDNLASGFSSSDSSDLLF